MFDFVIEWRIEWSLPEFNRTHYKEIINHFLKVFNELFSCFVTACIYGKFLPHAFAKGKTLGTERTPDENNAYVY